MIGFVFQNNCSECHVEARVKARVLLEKGREFLSASLCSVLLAAQAMLLMPPSFLESVIKAVLWYLPTFQESLGTGRVEAAGEVEK